MLTIKCTINKSYEYENDEVFIGTIPVLAGLNRM